MVDPFVQDFVAETWVHLSRLDGTLNALEIDPSRTELLDDAFRALHSIKGGCCVLRLDALGRVTHAAENLLETMRNGSLPVDAPSLQILRAGMDGMKDLLTGLEATGEEPTCDLNRLLAQFERLATPEQITTSDAGALAPPPISSEDRPRTAEQSIRVPLELLDRLIGHVSELVVVRNQFIELLRDHEEPNLTASMQHLDRVATDLQLAVLKTRRQPVGQAWSTLPRFVRDVSRIIGKPIELEIQGGDIEVDRTVLEALQDPLTHLIRNAADHGIEKPEVRRQAGKPDAGRLRLAAVSEPGRIVIRLEDDGAGISRRKVLQTALRQRLITAAEAEQFSDADILRLLFRPGFSTAPQVTTVSGRGVGLDIVRTAIERLGGTVEMTSDPGQGTTVCLIIPQTIASEMSQAASPVHESMPQEPSPVAVASPGETVSLLVFQSAAGAVMAVPVELISRVVEFPGQTLERCGEHWTVRDQGELIPLLSIAGSASEETPRELQSVILCSDARQTFGLLVEGIQEIVEEPLVIRQTSLRPGILGTAMIAGKSMEVLDMHHYRMQVQTVGNSLPIPSPASRSVLVIDDSLFFRQLIRAALETDGYATTTADCAEQAIALIDEGHSFDVILCDIEMPGMDGCQFAEWFRQRPVGADIPLAAMTSLDEEEHGPRIMAAGFDRMLHKFHPQQLRHALLNLLQLQEVASRRRCA